MKAAHPARLLAVLAFAVVLVDVVLFGYWSLTRRRHLSHDLYDPRLLAPAAVSLFAALGVLRDLAALAGEGGPGRAGRQQQA